MQITKVEALPVSVSRKKAFASALGAEPMKQKIVVTRVYTDEGIVGIGEATPGSIPASYHYESQESIISTINTYMAPAMIGKNPFDFETIFEEIGKIIYGNPFALAAIDFALYDIIGKKTGLPVCRLLGGVFREKVPLVWVLSLATKTEDIAKEAVEMVEKGYRTLKIKVGVDPKLDVERVKAVRNAVGDHAEIRVDTNQGWTPDLAIKMIKKLEKYELQLVEQPVAGWDLSGMARVTKAVDVPIMADESVFSPETAIKIVKMEAADILNVKVMKPGGLYNSKKIASIAEAANIPCVIGSMLETGIGTAASAHFAAAHRVVTYACEMIGPLFLAEDIVTKPIRIENGFLRIPTRPGLGVELNLERLEGRRSS